MSATNVKDHILGLKKSKNSLTMEKMEKWIRLKFLTNIPKKDTKKGRNCMYPHFFFLPSADVIATCVGTQRNTLKYCAFCGFCGAIRMFDATTKYNLDSHIENCHSHLSSAISQTFKKTNTLYEVCRLNLKSIYCYL